MEDIFSNKFGTVRKDRVTYFRGKGMFSGGSEEDVALRHVTSVRYEVVRRRVLGVIVILLGIGGAFGIGGIEAFLGGLLAIVVGVVLIIGTPIVVVSTAGGDKEIMKGVPWNKTEPQEFVKALKKKLFDETGGEG